MNKQFVSRLERCERHMEATEHPPLVIVTEYQDGHCEANGQRYPNMRAVEACYPLSLLIVGVEPAPAQ